jgi:hypothetical protein
MKVPTTALQSALINKFQIGLSEYGFSACEQKGSFEKHMPSSSWVFRLGFIKHELDVDAIASISVRLASLEELLSQIDITKQSNGFSLGCELGNLLDHRQKRWTMTSREDVEIVYKSILAMFVTTGVPYLEHFSIMHNALEIFSRDDKMGWLHCPVHVERAKRAIGAAFLLGNDTLLRELIQRKTAFLESRNDPDLPLFNRIKDNLQSRSMNI